MLTDRPIHLPPHRIIKPKVIIDLGCWVGVTTQAYAIYSPKAQVIGVELDSHNYQQAQSLLEPYGDRVKLINAAVWTYDGEVECRIWATETNYVKDTLSHANGHSVSHSRMVPCLTLDTITKDLELVDFIKFDIEASEHQILAAGGDWVDKTRSIFVEIHDVSNDNIRRAITNLGFRVVKEDFELIWAVNSRIEKFGNVDN